MNPTIIKTTQKQPLFLLQLLALNNNTAINEVSKELGVPAVQNVQHSMNTLAEKINELLNTDFNRLISILYRLDVHEEKLKQLLREQPGNDAGMIIAQLMIERQLQKLKSRENSGQPDTGANMDDSEKW